MGCGPSGMPDNAFCVQRRGLLWPRPGPEEERARHAAKLDVDDVRMHAARRDENP